MTTAADIAAGLGGRRAGRNWLARCPAHADRTPSLSIAEGEAGKVLVHCHGGCGQAAVLDALRAAGLWGGGGAPIELSAEQRELMRQRAAEREREALAKQARAIQIWQDSAPINRTPAERYLRSRGINPCLALYERGYPATLGWSEDIGAAPGGLLSGMVCAVCDDAGQVQAVQRIVLDRHGQVVRDKDGKKMKLCLGPISGHAWQGTGLSDGTGKWGIAEGVESALAAAQLFGRPVWAAISAGNLPKIQPPIWARSIKVYADHDRSGTGLNAARAALAAYRQLVPDALSSIWMSPTPGYDVADHLCEAAPYV